MYNSWLYLSFVLSEIVLVMFVTHENGLHRLHCFQVILCFFYFIISDAIAQMLLTFYADPLHLLINLDMVIAATCAKKGYKVLPAVVLTNAVVTYNLCSILDLVDAAHINTYDLVVLMLLRVLRPTNIYFVILIMQLVTLFALFKIYQL